MYTDTKIGGLSPLNLFPMLGKLGSGLRFKDVGMFMREPDSVVFRL